MWKPDCKHLALSYALRVPNAAAATLCAREIDEAMLALSEAVSIPQNYKPTLTANHQSDTNLSHHRIFLYHPHILSCQPHAPMKHKSHTLPYMIEEKRLPYITRKAPVVKWLRHSSNIPVVVTAIAQRLWQLRAGKQGRRFDCGLGR